MPKRKLIVPSNSRLLDVPGTKKLNSYPNGDILIETEAATDETGMSEAPVETGLQLNKGLPETLTKRHEDTNRTDRLEKYFAYVVFVGPTDPAWLERLRNTGVEPVRYQPNHCYLCRANAEAFSKAAKLKFVADIVDLSADIKPAPPSTEAGEQKVVVILAAPANVAQLLAALAAIPGVKIDLQQPVEVVNDQVRVQAEVTGDGQDALLKRDDVLAVEEFAERLTEDEVAGLILAGEYTSLGRPQGSYVGWLERLGLSGHGVTIGVVDSGTDATHVAFTGRIKDLTGGRKSWHGTFVAGHAAGNYLNEKDANGFVYGLGMAPRSEILVQDNRKEAGELCGQTVNTGGPSGWKGSVQNNSWGQGTKDPMDYGSLEAAYDRLVRNADLASSEAKPLTICFSAGNSGSAGLTRPKGAKNIIVTGNSECYRPDSPGAQESDNINEVFEGSHSSSFGNCGDGRVRPDVVTPGEWTASANFDSRFGQKEFISVKLTWGGGTSGASPKTAGACALLTEWWRTNHSGANPSPAMLRSLIVNGAVDIGYGGPIPNPRQGWGRLNLNNIVSPQIRAVYSDQAFLLTTIGETKQWKLRVSDPLKPVRITLCWTDPPGPLNSGTAAVPAIVNRLALRVQAGGAEYRGNNFSNGSSIAGPLSVPAQEGRDNLQNVFLSAGKAGDRFTVSVMALNLTTNCLTNAIDSPKQDFALVVSNAVVDEATGANEVAVAVDSASNSQSTGGQPGDLWKDGAGNNDTAAAGQPVTPPPPKPPEPSPADDQWWSDDSVWTKSETERESETQVDPGVVSAGSVGAEIARAFGNNTVIVAGGKKDEAGGPDTPVRIEPETKPAEAESALQSSLSVPLGEAISKLLASWREATAQTPRRRTAVLAVGKGTRFSLADVEGMRELSALGTLYIVSDSRAAILFLASRVRRETGIQFRFSENLAETFRATVIEASGGQRLEVVPALRDTFTAYPFELLPEDLGLVVYLETNTATEPKVFVRTPGSTERRPVEAIPGVTMQKQGPAKRMVFNRPADPSAWAGQWTIEVEVAAGAQTRLSAWVRTTHRLRVEKLNGAGPPNSDGESIVIRGGATTAFAHMAIQDQRLTEEVAAAEEQERAIVVSSEAPRILTEGREEAPREVLTHSLSGRVPKIDVGQWGAVRIVRVHVAGVTGDYRFRRSVDASLTYLPPLAVWRNSIDSQAERVVFTPARIVAFMQGERGRIEALRIEYKGRQRNVLIRSDAVREQLERLDHKAPDLHFAVLKGEVIAVFRVPGVTELVAAATDNDYRVDGPIVEPPVAEAPGAADYDFATRFVQARHFRASARPRTIRRVVIHITDGGPKVDGVIAWFQDPVRDGQAVPVSAHYIVGQNGEVVQMVRNNDVAYHAGTANADSIGIEHCARNPRTSTGIDAGLYPSRTQYAASAALTRWLCEKYEIPMDRQHIVGHSEVDPRTTHKGCPNSVWDWDTYMRMVLEASSLPS